MLLTEEIFQSILGICIVNCSDDEAERREHPRVEFGRRATIIPLIDGKPGRGKVVVIRDMSVKGMGMLDSEPMRPLDEFILDLSKFVGRPLGIRCAIERCESGGTGGTQFVLGATFEELLESPEQLVLAPEPIAVALPNRRKREPVLARVRKLLPRPTWNWLAPARRTATQAPRTSPR